MSVLIKCTLCFKIGAVQRKSDCAASLMSFNTSGDMYIICCTKYELK